MEGWARDHQAAWREWQHCAESLLAAGNCEEGDVERMLDDAGQYAFGTAAIDLAAVHRLSARLATALDWSSQVTSPLFLPTPPPTLMR